MSIEEIRISHAFFSDFAVLEFSFNQDDFLRLSRLHRVLIIVLAEVKCDVIAQQNLKKTPPIWERLIRIFEKALRNIFIGKFSKINQNVHGFWVHRDFLFSILIGIYVSFADKVIDI